MAEDSDKYVEITPSRIFSTYPKEYAMYRHTDMQTH